jgi:putative DNA primase/helicase
MSEPSTTPNHARAAVHPFFDFNDAPAATKPELDREQLRAKLLDRLESVLMHLFPAGQIKGDKFYVGDIHGAPGKSLVVELKGAKRGLWKDFAGDDGGDILDLWAMAKGLSARLDFLQVMQDIGQWLGVVPNSALTSVVTTVPNPRAPHVDELGPPTAKWDYCNAQGELIACVYRYDPASGKEFRPWDVRTRMWRAPDPRPLYNLPAVAAARTVVLVEGEKCADALIGIGVIATTAMNGAKAPINKTDWALLKGKHVVIWPDRDAPGWDYAENAARACAQAACASVVILVPPDDKPEKWDCADGVEEGFDCLSFIAGGERQTIKAPAPVLPSFSLGQLLDDDSPMPPDIIEPKVLTPGSLMVFGGAPKVGKSDLLLALLAHMAAGATFLGMRPARPLRIFYLQAEVQYYYLRERVKAIKLPAHRIKDARDNLISTPQVHLILNDAGVAQAIAAIREAFPQEPADIIAIDPLRNVFDGGEGSNGENDNAAMLYFLQQRIERILNAVNPKGGVILVHHTRKMGKKQFEEDPFQAFAGAGSLRGFYSSGLVLHRPDESSSIRQLIFELRNGPAIPTKHVDKIKGEWREVNSNQRLVLQDHGAKLDAERRRKHDAIVQILFDEAANGRCYTANQFADSFEGKAGLGANRTINERVAVLASQGYVKFCKEHEPYGLPSFGRSKFGYLCVEDMALTRPVGEPDELTGEVSTDSLRVYPTHYKCPQTGALLPVENPDIWIYQEELS